jgi:hypothetical protein
MEGDEMRELKFQPPTRRRFVVPRCPGLEMTVLEQPPRHLIRKQFL